MAVALSRGVLQPRYLVLVGRILFALVFLYTVIPHFSSAAIEQARAAGVPLPTLVVPLSGLLAFAGGLLVALGYRARFGAFLLVLFLLPVTIVMHAFWHVPDPALAVGQKAAFLKNLALMGGALLIMDSGAGPLSFDD